MDYFEGEVNINKVKRRELDEEEERIIADCTICKATCK